MPCLACDCSYHIHYISFAIGSCCCCCCLLFACLLFNICENVCVYVRGFAIFNFIDSFISLKVSNIWLYSSNIVRFAFQQQKIVHNLLLQNIDRAIEIGMLQYMKKSRQHHLCAVNMHHKSLHFNRPTNTHKHRHRHEPTECLLNLLEKFMKPKRLNEIFSFAISVNSQHTKFRFRSVHQKKCHCLGVF